MSQVAASIILNGAGQIINVNGKEYTLYEQQKREEDDQKYVKELIEEDRD